MNDDAIARDRAYTLKSVQEMLGISRHAVTSLIDAGFVTPARGPRNEYRFGFRDLVLLRTAHGLRQAQVPARRIVQSLKRLSAQLPEGLPLTGLRVTAVGDQVAVHEGASRWNAESGQWLLDFEVSVAKGQVHVSAPSSPPVAPQRSAADWQAEGEAREAGDPAAAEAAYRRAIDLDACFADAYANLSALLCETGRAAQAVQLLEKGIEQCKDSALLHYNLAVALEDEGRPFDALAAYERGLAVDGAMVDAHFNAARLAEELGDSRRALRHLNAYRKLSR